MKMEKNRVHRPGHSSSFSVIVCGPLWGLFPVLGSFAVQFGDHLRSGIICGAVTWQTPDHVNLKISKYIGYFNYFKMAEGSSLVDFKSRYPVIARVFSPSAAILKNEKTLGTRLRTFGSPPGMHRTPRRSQITHERNNYSFSVYVQLVSRNASSRAT